MSNSYFSNLMYDIETMFLEGKSALEMADELEMKMIPFLIMQRVMRTLVPT